MDSLTEQVTNANSLFDKVNRPSEAVLDSRLLIATSEAGALKARQLKLDADAFDTDEFLVRLLKFIGGRSARSLRRKRTRKGPGQAGLDSDDASDDGLEDDDDDRPMKWNKVGRVLAGQSRRAPPLDFMCVLSPGPALRFAWVSRHILTQGFSQRYGPLAIEVKEKKARVQRAKNQWDAEQTRPEEVGLPFHCWSLLCGCA